MSSSSSISQIIDVSENSSSLENEQKCEEPKNENKKYFHEENLIKFYHSNSKAPSLSIMVNSKSDDITIFKKLSKNFLHGYNKFNAVKALTKFVQRKLIQIEAVNVEEKRLDNYKYFSIYLKQYEYEAMLTVTIPNAKIRGVKFHATSRTKNDAELTVALIVLEEMFTFDIIKEASIELYCKGRKKFINPILSLNKNSRFFLEDANNLFLKKINDLNVALYSKCQVNYNNIIATINSTVQENNFTKIFENCPTDKIIDF